MKNKTTFASIFGNETNISEAERARVVSEIEKIGSLTFKIEHNEEGWTAECAEVPGIITGNTNPNPSDLEIQSAIREAIFSAFNVQFENDEAVVSPLQFGYSLRFA